MRRLLLTAGLFFLSTTFAFALTPQEEEQFVNQTLAIFGRGPLVLPDTLPVHRICGTATLMDAKQRFGTLSPKAQAALAPLLYSRPVMQKSYDTPSGHFRIHYDETGAAAVPDPTIKNAQGVPVWVDTLGMVLDSVWDREVVQLGFRAPVSDSFYAAFQDNGGDGRRDFYLDTLPSGLLGYTVPDSAGGGVGALGLRATAFIVLDNDYTIYPDPTTRRRVLRVTIAHEFFHAVQFAYTAYNWEQPGSYWYEASATWMEDMVYNEINDYVNYLRFWFDRPDLSFRTFSSNFGGDPDRAYRPYAMAIYGHYLSKRFPNPSFGYSIIRKIWENMAPFAGFNLFDAIGSALGSTGFMPTASANQRFIASLQEFYRWNYFVRNKRPTVPPDTLYGAESDLWPSFEQRSKVDFNFSYPTRFPTAITPCTNCPAASISFFCSPCTQGGTPCSTRCPPCSYIPYQPSLSFVCLNDIEDLGASYVNLDYPGSGTDAVFSLIGDSSNAARFAPWGVAAVGYNTFARSYSFIDSASTPPTKRMDSLVLPNFGNYTEIVAIVTNTEFLANNAARQTSAYAYFADTTATPTGVENEPANRPKSYALYQNRPNPFNPATTITFYLPASGQATLEIFNIAGQRVKVLLGERISAGMHSLDWDGRDEDGRRVASGIYLYRLKTDTFSEVKRMVLLK